MSDRAQGEQAEQIEKGEEPRDAGSVGPAARSLSERLQATAVPIIAVATLLALGAGTGLSPIPHGSAGLAWWFHPLLLIWGAAAGVVAMKRMREIEAERWDVVSDDALTSPERAYAHKEAEHQMRSSITVLVLAAVSVGTWLAYQLRDASQITAADLLVVTPLIGFGLGMIWAARRFPKPEPRW